MTYMTSATSLTEQSDVRRQVLDAAIDIISREGVENVSMREVARQAGVSHQAPYHYFGDRAGIFAAISEEGFFGLADALERAYADTAHPTRDGLAAYVAFARSHQGHFRVMFRNDICGISTHPSTLDAADKAFNALLSLVHRFVGDSPDEESSLMWATTMWSTAHGLATLIIDGPLMPRLAKHSDVTDAEKFIDTVIDHFGSIVTQQTKTLFNT